MYLICSPELFNKMMNAKKIYLEWKRYTIYEDLEVTRCYNCQGFYHKQKDCINSKICCNCGEHHDSSLCHCNVKKCKNCKCQTNYNVDHSANDLSCPTYKYHLEILRSRIDYGEEWLS